MILDRIDCPGFQASVHESSAYASEDLTGNVEPQDAEGDRISLRRRSASVVQDVRYAVKAGCRQIADSISDDRFPASHGVGVSTGRNLE